MAAAFLALTDTYGPLHGISVGLKTSLVTIERVP
jgi:hypothetical protein